MFLFKLKYTTPHAPQKNKQNKAKQKQNKTINTGNKYVILINHEHLQRRRRRRGRRRKIGRTDREKGDLNNHINFQFCTFFASQVGFFKRKKKLTADQRKMLESSNGVENEGLEGVDKTEE